MNEGSRLVQDTGANEYDFSFWGRAGRTYFIQTSTDLIHWQDVEVEWGTDQIIGYGFYSTAPRFFLRLRHIEGQSGDVDGDDLSDADEIAGGTDPFSIDSDGDNWDDAWEIAIGSNPLSQQDAPESAREERHDVSETDVVEYPVTFGSQIKWLSNGGAVHSNGSVFASMSWYDEVSGYGSTSYSVFEPRWAPQLSSLDWPEGNEWALHNPWLALTAGADSYQSSSSSGQSFSVSVEQFRAVLTVDDLDPSHVQPWAVTRRYFIAKTRIPNEGGPSLFENHGFVTLTIPQGGRHSEPVILDPQPVAGYQTRLMLSPVEFNTYGVAGAGLGLDKSVYPSWLMVPAGQARFVWVSTGAAPWCPFWFKMLPETMQTISPPMSLIIGDEINGPVLSFTSNGITGDLQSLSLGVGSDFSDSDPVLRFTVKPHRVLRVTVHPITLLSSGGAVRAAPADVPTEQQLEDYLDSIFGEQANIYTDVTVNATAAVNWDVGVGFSLNEKGYGNGSLEIAGHGGHLTEEERNIQAVAHSATAHVNVYWIASPNSYVALQTVSRNLAANGTSSLYWNEYSPVLGFAKGEPTLQGTVYVWEYAYESPTDTNRSRPSSRLWVVAHEIAHHVGNLGHSSGIVWKPFQKRANSDNDLRLMSGRGGKKRYDCPPLLIKEEWDQLHINIPNP